MRCNRGLPYFWPPRVALGSSVLGEESHLPLQRVVALPTLLDQTLTGKFLEVDGSA
jgi:hypothetical protein